MHYARAGFCSRLQVINNLCPQLALQEQHPLQNGAVLASITSSGAPRRNEEPLPSLPPPLLSVNLFGSFIKATEQFRLLFFFLPPSPVWFSV